MEIPTEAIYELKEIFYRLSGEKLTDKEATILGKNLFSLFLSVYEPIPLEWLNEFLLVDDN